VLTLASNSEKDTGLEIQSLAPASKHSSALKLLSMAVRISIGIDEDI
jgi:hypothetical protein